MFRPGQVFKVKVELSAEQVGFGRATILEADGKRILFRLRSARGDKQLVPRGTRLWFVGNVNENRMNGLWFSVVTNTRLHAGQQAIECNVPVFQPFKQDEQRRKYKRAPIQVPVLLKGNIWSDLEDSVVSRNVSRSGLGISVLQECPERFNPGDDIAIVLQTATVDITLHGRVINARYNWLSNRTDVGLEFAGLTSEAVDALDRVLQWLGTRTRKETGEVLQKSEAGALAAWMKTTPDDRSFVRTASGAVGTDMNDVTEGVDPNQADAADDVDPADFDDNSERGHDYKSQ